MKGNHVPHAFVLGCERCGSTWLSNVLDIHPDTEFFMEPFADYADLFPGMVGRNLYVEPRSENLARILRAGYANLRASKYPLFYRREKSPHWKRVDRGLVAFYHLIARVLRFRPALSVLQFELLNLHQRKVPVPLQVKKSTQPAMHVTKELRLNFKIGLLNEAFPGSKYIIAVRHPGAQVASIMRLLARGHLGELQRSLLGLHANLRSASRFDRYSDGYVCLDKEQITHDMLLLWWLISYQTVIEDCKRFDLDYKIVFNEDLSNAPEEEYGRIFSFLGLEYSANVRNYVRYSTTGSGHGGAAERSPLDTVRDSALYSRKSIANVDDETKRGIADLFDRFDVTEELRRYHPPPQNGDTPL